jgi:hypothetical protein
MMDDEETQRSSYSDSFGVHGSRLSLRSAGMTN